MNIIINDIEFQHIETTTKDSMYRKMVINKQKVHYTIYINDESHTILRGSLAINLDESLIKSIQSQIENSLCVQFRVV